MRVSLRFAVRVVAGLALGISALAPIGLSAQTPPAPQSPNKPSASPPAQAPAPQTPAKSSPTPSGQAQPQITPGQIVAAKPDPWLPLRFLMGAWEAKTTGGIAQLQATANFAFRLELHAHVLARHTTRGPCNAIDDFDCRHPDLLYIYPSDSGQGFLAICFDNEGHVIHYTVSTPNSGAAILLSDPAQPGPQYRLSYQLLEGTMTGKLEVKLPGQNDFIPYLEWSSQAK